MGIGVFDEAPFLVVCVSSLFSIGKRGQRIRGIPSLFPTTPTANSWQLTPPQPSMPQRTA